MSKPKGSGLLGPGRFSMAAAVAKMLSDQRWQDGPGGKHRDPDRLREDRDERKRMENEFDRIWEGQDT